MNLTPMRWPGIWKNPSALTLLQGTAINCLLFDKDANLAPVSVRARQEGLRVVDTGSPVEGVVVVQGEWPGVKLNPSGQMDHAGAGPTGVPWVDSNGWKIRLTSSLHPDKAVIEAGGMLNRAQVGSAAGQNLAGLRPSAIRLAGLGQRQAGCCQGQTLKIPISWPTTSRF